MMEDAVCDQIVKKLNRVNDDEVKKFIQYTKATDLSSKIVCLIKSMSDRIRMLEKKLGEKPRGKSGVKKTFIAGVCAPDAKEDWEGEGVAGARVPDTRKDWEGEGEARNDDG